MAHGMIQGPKFSAPFLRLVNMAMDGDWHIANLFYRALGRLEGWCAECTTGLRLKVDMNLTVWITGCFISGFIQNLVR